MNEEDTEVYVVKTELNKKVQVEHTIETFDTSVIQSDAKIAYF